MASTSPERVTVVRGTKEEPLLAGRPSLSSVDSPWKGIVLERQMVGSVEIPEHAHSSLCMHLQLRGNVAMEWWSGGRNGVESPRTGSLILLPEGTCDRLRWQGESERLIVAVAPALMHRAAMDAGLSATPEMAMHWHLRDAGLSALLAEMGREAEAGWPAGSLYGDLLGMSLAQLLLRRHTVAEIAIRDTDGGIPLPRLRRVLEYVQAHLHADIRLEQLAAEAGLSPFHFARMFRESTHLTPYQYVLERRIARAQELLALGTETIADVATESGFSSATNFSRCFRMRVGVSPRRWLRSR